MDSGDKRTENESLPVGGDYLWDRSGEPDPEIRRLETVLGELRHHRPAPVFPEFAREARWTFLPLPLRRFPVLSATAALAAITVLAFVMFREKPSARTFVGWNVSRVAGTPRIGPGRLGEKEKSSRFGVGQILETDPQSRASLHADNVGQIDVDPSTRLRLLDMGSGLKRIALDHGTIHAFIWATPGQFVVDTPSAVTVDLGCAYTLHVDDSGAGTVQTSLGWVGFKLHGHESFIPAGAACATRPKVGPGTPYFEDASLTFRDALSRFDFADDTPEKRAEDVTIVLHQARNHDSLTLWHLLARVDRSQRVAVYDRLKGFAPPPAGVTREGILQLDQPMLDLWWNELGFDDISTWRRWERSWSGEDAPKRQE